VSTITRDGLRHDDGGYRFCVAPRVPRDAPRLQAVACYYALTERFSVDDLASGDRSAADAMAEYAAIARAVSWAAVHERLPYHQDPARQAPGTLLPHQVGTVAARRRHYVRVVGVPRSPQAPLGVMLADPRLPDAVPRSLPVTEQAWAVPDGFSLSDPGNVPSSTEETAASAAYHARKRRHADTERGGPAQSDSAIPGSPVGAAPDGPVAPAAFPRRAVAGLRNSMTTTPAWPVPNLVTGGGPLPSAAPEAPATTPGTVRTEEWAAVPACGMPAHGRRPVRATVAAVLLRAATTT